MIIPEEITMSNLGCPDNPQEYERYHHHVEGYNRAIADMREAMGPFPMPTAPRDGTVVLVFADGTDFPQAMRYGKARSYSLRSKPEAWRVAWDDTALRECDLLGWVPCPTYAGGPVR